jgi:hypothetical protein
VWAGLGIESEPCSGKETAPTGGVRLSASERGRGKEVGRMGEVGPGRKNRLGRAERRRREGERPGWAGLQGEKERGKRKEGVGWAQLGKEGEKELHSNAFEFEFET